MKALITRRSIIIASVALLLAIVAIVSVNVFNSAGPVTGLANTITRPVRALASTVARTFETIFSAIYRYDELLERNAELERIIVERELDFLDSEALAAENAQLRDLLEFRERHGGWTQEVATLRSWNADNWSSTFVINKGYMNSDIEPGMAVATEYGALIGQVSEVGATDSTVTTIIDTTFSAAVFIGGDGTDVTDATATAKGDFSHMRSGLLILEYIDDDLVVNPGALIVTSGHGGVFPPGLTVGNIETVHGHTSGLGRYATVRPMRDINTINNVIIITDFENPNIVE